MLCCAKLLETMLRWLVLCTLLLSTTQAAAEGIDIRKAEARLTNEGYLLSADFDIKLPSQVEEALMRGVTLYFESELSVHRSRWYWPDQEIASFTQTSKLSYNTLTQQYRLTRGGLYQTFVSLPDALRVLGRQVAPPIEIAQLDQASGGYFSRLIKKGSQVGVVAWMGLDITQLPKPLQMNVLTDDQWKLESVRFHWDIRPEEGSSE